MLRRATRSRVRLTVKFLVPSGKPFGLEADPRVEGCKLVGLWLDLMCVDPFWRLYKDML